MNGRKHKIKNALVALVAGLSFLSRFHPAGAQNPLPDSDIFLVPIRTDGSTVTLDEGRMVTKLRTYDDHPSFSHEGNYMYYTAEGDDYRTDIHAVFVRQMQSLEFIGTGTVSESHPSQKPDMTGIAAVRFDPIANARQVWFYGTDASERSLTPTITDVASFQWYNDSTLTVLLEGASRTLCLYYLRSKSHDTLVTNVGTSYAKVPSENAVYYSQTVKGLEHLYRYNVDTKKSEALLYLPGGAVEFAVAMDGSLWSANSGMVYRWRRAAGGWDTVKDFGSGALGGAFRLAVSRDMKWLAVVTRKAN